MTTAYEKHLAEWINQQDDDFKRAAREGQLQFEAQQQELLAASEIERFLYTLGNTGKALDYVVDNARLLKSKGLFERGLLCAWLGSKTNIRNWSRSLPRTFFSSFSDRSALLEAGQPLPGDGPFTLYRGVAGAGAARRIRGISWTSSLECARWFATWYADRFRLPNPSVYKSLVPKENVLAYSNDRKEQEFLLCLPRGHKVDLFARLSAEQAAFPQKAEFAALKYRPAA